MVVYFTPQGIPAVSTERIICSWVLTGISGALCEWERVQHKACPTGANDLWSSSSRLVILLSLLESQYLLCLINVMK